MEMIYFMKSIAIILFFLSIISAGFAIYSFDFSKNVVSENLLGQTENFLSQADVFSNSFQFVEEVDLESRRKNQLSTSDVDSVSTKPVVNNQPVVTSKISADIIDTDAAAATNIIAATTTNIEATASIATTTNAEVISIMPPIAPLIASSSESINISNHIIISEILAGIDGNANYEFIELYNPNNSAIDLIGWSIKKRSSTGSESTLVSNNTKAGDFKNKKIIPKSYLLLAQKDGYNSSVQPDILYSGTLAYKNNAIILYNADGEAIEDIGWDEIAKGQSLERVFNGNDWNKGEFKIQNNPNPQNSSF